MSINLNLRAPAANPLTFQQVDSNFNQLKTAIENVQNSLQSLANVNHNHNDLYYLKSEVNQLIADITWKGLYDSPSFSVGVLGGVKFGWGYATIPLGVGGDSSLRFTFGKSYDLLGPVVIAQLMDEIPFSKGPAPYLNVRDVDRFGFSIYTDTIVRQFNNITTGVGFRFFCFGAW